MNGADAWEWVRGRLQVGTMVRNWTAANGYISRGDFTVTEIGQDHVEVELSGSSRKLVPAGDFRKVGEFWTAYCAGELRRHELRDRPNMNTKCPFLAAIGVGGKDINGYVAPSERL